MHNRDDAPEPQTMVMQAIYLHQKWALGSNNGNNILSRDLSYTSHVSARPSEHKASGPPEHQHFQIARGAEWLQCSSTMNTVGEGTVC